jgi:hypothetical protein
MAGAQNKLLALDANILFDLAAGKEFAHDFRETFLSKGYALLVPPTVVQELVHFFDDGSRQQSTLAEKALRSMLSWRIKPFDLVAVGHGITERFYERLVKKGLLPTEEKHDGLILAESSLMCIPVLVTCDEHLLGMEKSLLKTTFEDADMFPVMPFHPREIWQSLR